MTNELRGDPPLLTGRLIRGNSVVEAGPRATWHWEELVDDLLAPMGEESADADDRGPTIELLGTFAGSPPGLELRPEVVQRLANRRASLAMSLDPIELGILARRNGSRRSGVNSTELSVSFRVRGDFDPAWFTAQTGIEPTATSRKDAARRIKAKVDTWRLEATQVAAPDFPASATEYLLGQLLPRIDALRFAATSSGLRTSLRYSATCVDQVPGLHLSEHQISRIARLGSWLEYSLIIPRENDDYLEF